MVQDAWSQVQMTEVSGVGVLHFFLGYILAAGIACFVYRDRSVLLWVAAVLGATAFLALNHVWHWHNHSYRFAINLIFPLGILSALAFRHGPRPLALGAGVWLGLVCAVDVGEFTAGEHRWVAHRVAEPDRAAFLRAVRETTAPHEGTGLRILNPPELSYARGVGQAAMLMNYSRIQAFVPDYRFVLWRESLKWRTLLMRDSVPRIWRPIESLLLLDLSMNLILQRKTRSGGGDIMQQVLERGMLFLTPFLITWLLLV